LNNPHYSRRYFQLTLTLAGVLVMLLQTAGLGVAQADAPSAEPAPRTPIHHLIVILQENHTFDNYFGTYPGVDGLPATVKMPVDPTNLAAGYVEPFHIGAYPITDLSHSSTTFNAQYDQGKMDGFVSALNTLKQNGKLSMGYYDGEDIPYYWNLADQYVLFDRFFSSAKDGSFANHVYWVAGVPPVTDNVRNDSNAYDQIPTIFDRLQEKGISWKFYVQNYDPTITYRNLGNGGNRESQVIWVPLLNFNRFLDNPVLASHIVDLNNYYTDLKNGTLPSVVYIAPSGASEHPPGSINTGQRFVKTLIQELMRSPEWSSSAFLLAYDDWGGWYDHVAPPQVDQGGYGLRVPALLVSPYARKGWVDNTQLDFTSVLKFIEENWNIAPLATRDAAANNFLEAFDFNSAPRQAAFISMERGTAAPKKVIPVQFIYIAYGVALLTAFTFILVAIIRSAMADKRKPRTTPAHSGGDS
jgi:phospholipase C